MGEKTPQKNVYTYTIVYIFAQPIAWNFNDVIIDNFGRNVPYTGSLLGHGPGEIGHFYSYKLKTLNMNLIFMGKSVCKDVVLSRTVTHTIKMSPSAIIAADIC